MAKHPELSPLTSSLLSGHHYDPDTRQLHLGFNSGQVYRYDDVGIDKAEALAGSASPGRYFGSRIRGHHHSTLVKG